MSGEGIRLRGVPAHGVAVLTVGMVLLAGSRSMPAQRGGGGRGATRGKPLICVYDCPDIPERISSENDLKTFEHRMAVEASSDQSAAFIKVMQYAQAASTQVQALRDLLQKGPDSTGLSDRGAGLDRAIKEARAGNQNFLASFSPVQESGLKDLTNKLLQADSDLDIQIKTLDRTLGTARAKSEQIATSAANLEQALASFQDGQLALANEMGIILPSSAQDLTLRLAPVATSIDIAGHSITVTGTSLVSRTSAADGHNLFGLRFIDDLSDVQQNITGVLRSQLNRSPRCGERIEVQEGALVSEAPASLVVTHLHYERWICPAFQGRESTMELAEGEGEIEIRLTPSVEANGGLHLASEISKVDANGSLRESLLSGPLGVTLREQITASLLSIVQKGANLKAAIPSPAEQFATIRKLQFQDAGAGRLTLILEGQLQLSDEQVKQFTDQLKERLSAREASP